MKKADIKVGGAYLAKVSGHLTTVVIERNYGSGWYAKNTKTGRPVWIRSAQRLRKEVTA